MFTVNADSVQRYLREKSLLSADETVTVTELQGGVSNTVLKVVTKDKRWVVKQALPRLKVEQEWISSVERMEREEECMEYVSGLLATGAVPLLVHRDPENHLCIMTCAPDGAANWKEMLLDGQAEPALAAQAGSLLGTIHRLSHGDEAAVRRFGDKKFFHELRLDPFYGRIAEVHPRQADLIGSYAAALAASSICFVHGDYSPKNFLASRGRLILLDFEVGHIGHPAFDLGFMVAHLTLKTIKFWSRRDDYLMLITSFWNAYVPAATFESEAWHERGFLPHLGCLLLARMDGKSPVNYLPNDADRNRVRALAASLISREIPSMRVYLDILSRAA